MNPNTLKAERKQKEGFPAYYDCPKCEQWLATEDEQGATLLHPQATPNGDSFTLIGGYLMTPEGQESLAGLRRKIQEAKTAGHHNVVFNLEQTIKIFSNSDFPDADWRTTQTPQPLKITTSMNVVCRCGACVQVAPRKTKTAEPTQTATAYDLHTGEECAAFVRSAGDGKSEKNWRNEQQRQVHLWEVEGAPFRVELSQLQDDDEFAFSPVEELAKSQSIDSAFALFYVCGVLSPPGAEKRRLVGGWIDLNDLMRNIGFLAEKPDTARKDELRAQVWEFLKYGARAKVTGARSIPYKDPDTGQVIPTRLESAPWKVTDVQRPEGQPDAAPVRAYIVISQQWTPLLTSPHLAQYMPLGELLAEVAPKKVGGDWARVIGYTLATRWRIKPRETQARTYSPTRRALLTTYTPKKTLEEVLSSLNPKRAVEYYRDALQILAEGGFIAREGDAAPEVTPETMLKPYGRKGWAEPFFDGESGVFPGPRWAPAVEQRAAALPAINPKDLKTKPKKHPKSSE